jgi:hypothetical protein
MRRENLANGLGPARRDGGMGRFRRGAGMAALLATIALGACAPVLSHGPRVRNGTAAGVTGAMMSNGDDESMPVLVPYLTVGSDRGADNGGRQFTAQMIIPTAAFDQDSDNDGMIFGMQGDYYVQSPTRDPRVVHGFGVHAGFFQIMPYAQVGVYENGFGVYTTQGVGSMGAWMGLAPEALFWSPGFGAELDLDGMTVRASLSTLVGMSMDRMEKFDDMPVTIGFSIEAGAPFAGKGDR